MNLKAEVIDMKEEVKQVKEEQRKSFARELLEDYKKTNRRLFIITIVILIMWFITGSYLVYILNDIGVEEVTETTTQEISDVSSINDSYIINGDNNENKAN